MASSSPSTASTCTPVNGRDEPEPERRFSLEEALRAQRERPREGTEVRAALYVPSLDAAKELVDQLEHLRVEDEAAPVVFDGELGELQYFICPAPAVLHENLIRENSPSD